MNTTPRRSIAVAGASGFVGHALVDALRADHDVIALARSTSAHDDDAAVTWHACDLFHFARPRTRWLAPTPRSISCTR